jgi:YHS domain-containing protein
MGHRRRHLLALAGVAAGLALAGTPSAPLRAEPALPINTLESGGVAIKGTDPVAYFLEGRPVPGKPEHGLDWQGARFLFASAANQERFAADPERYAPVYGGYCAYGVSRGYLVKIEPEAWTIHEGRLFLNYDLAVRDTWLEDVPGYVAKADAEFPKLVPGDAR